LEQSIKTSLIGRLEAFECSINLAASKVDSNWLWRPMNQYISSVGVQIQHLSGNLNQYMVVNLNGSADLRDRPLEFIPSPELGITELLAELNKHLNSAKVAIKKAPCGVWTEVYQVQNFQMTRLEACIHGVEHLNYHLGQIALIIKYHKPQDLGFYPDI